MINYISIVAKPNNMIEGIIGSVVVAHKNKVYKKDVHFSKEFLDAITPKLIYDLLFEEAKEELWKGIEKDLNRPNLKIVKEK